MHSFVIWEQNDAEKPSLRFRNRRPSAYSAICLNNLFHGVLNDALYQFDFYLGTVGSRPHGLKVLG